MTMPPSVSSPPDPALPLVLAALESAIVLNYLCVDIEQNITVHLRHAKISFSLRSAPSVQTRTLDGDHLAVTTLLPDSSGGP